MSRLPEGLAQPRRDETDRRLLAGEQPKAIAADLGVSIKYVCQRAAYAGLRRYYLTPAEWRRVVAGRRGLAAAA